MNTAILLFRRSTTKSNSLHQFSTVQQQYHRISKITKKLRIQHQKLKINSKTLTMSTSLCQVQHLTQRTPLLRIADWTQMSFLRLTDLNTRQISSVRNHPFHRLTDLRSLRTTLMIPTLCAMIINKKISRWGFLKFQPRSNSRNSRCYNTVISTGIHSRIYRHLFYRAIMGIALIPVHQPMRFIMTIPRTLLTETVSGRIRLK